MQLSPAQLEAVKSWLAEGASLSDVQKHLKEEFGISMLYLDLRMLVLDIGASVKEAPKKTEPPKPAATESEVVESEVADDTDEFDEAENDAPGGTPRIPVTLDRVMNPGALVSGEAVFPGNQKIHWILDRMGRLAIDQAPPDFKPSQDEATAFQLSLRETLMKNGYA